MLLLQVNDLVKVNNVCQKYDSIAAEAAWFDVQCIVC